MSPAVVVLSVCLGLSLLVIAGFWLVGWAYNLGMRDGRKAERGDIMRRIMTPEFTQELVRNVQSAQRHESLKRFGTPLPPHDQ